MPKEESGYAPFEEEFEIHLPKDGDARKIVASNLAAGACALIAAGDKGDTGKKAMYIYSFIERKLEEIATR